MGAMSRASAIDVPPVAFTPWVRWKKRHELRSKDGQPSMGVYLWARFRRPPVPQASPYPELPPEVVYVGQTNNLNVRPLGVPRHHRLAHYIDTFGDREHRHLYVSVCHVRPFIRNDSDCYSLWAYTRYLEARLYWEYVQRYRRRPALDYKSGKERPY
jgi:hypothetical protein